MQREKLGQKTYTSAMPSVAERVAAADAAEASVAERVAAAKEKHAAKAGESAAPAAETADAGRRVEEKSSDAGDASGSAGCAALEEEAALSDATFEKLVMDKSKDVFVLFYKTSAPFCMGNATGYADFRQQLLTLPTVVAHHMDVNLHKSPFVFDDGELPVAMLFPSEDKRPLEFDKAMNAHNLIDFAHEHATTLKGKKPTKEEL